MVRSRATLAAGALLLAASLGLTACGSNGEGDDGADAKSLTLWHYEGANSAMGIAWNEAINQFKASHPGVEVKFEERGFEQIQQNAGMILNSDSAPDIMEYNKGNATAGLLSKQGLLTDLTEQARSRGWEKALSPSLQTTAKYSQDGIMGGDKFYGVPNYGEYVMVYYNKDLFAKHKVAVPTSLAEFETAMDTFVKAGVTPIATAGAEYPAHQIFYELALAKADRSFVDKFELYKGKVDFHGPELTFGAQTFADWVKKGYIPKTSASLKAEDMGVAFEQGKYPIMISGSWWFGRLAKEINKFQWGTFLFPGNKLHPGSSGNLWVVPTKSKAKKLAYDFIDITMKPEIQNLLANNGGIPVAADLSKITDPRNKELNDNFARIASNDGLAFYSDWPAPGYYDVNVSAVQGLINGSKTPAAALDQLAKPYQENLSNIGK
ncbi:ABC transporter substrate-binding protein [Micromonospora zhanjiangensis]|uniref:ABC transporter substrate-binding protein n=1 Tax=Micromonospora zhanjiangensis TaxID=1522057 RepID=A0ABV8KNV5_9ACTN